MLPRPNFSLIFSWTDIKLDVALGLIGTDPLTKFTRNICINQKASSLITRRESPSQSSKCPCLPCRTPGQPHPQSDECLLLIYEIRSKGCSQWHFHSGCRSETIILVLNAPDQISLTLARAGEMLPNSCPQTYFSGFCSS